MTEDENGEHIITDYNVSFPDNIKIGLGQIFTTNPEEILSLPKLDINLAEIDNTTKNKAQIIVERLSNYYFDEK